MRLLLKLASSLVAMAHSRSFLQGAAHGLPVHAVVFVEARVLRGDDGERQAGRDPGNGNRDPLEPRTLSGSRQLLLAALHERRRLREVRLESGHVRKCREEQDHGQTAGRHCDRENSNNRPRLSPRGFRRTVGRDVQLEALDPEAWNPSSLYPRAAAMERRSLRTPSSASSRERVRGGRRRMAEAPEASAISPFSRAAARVRSRVALSGRSSARKRPRPRTFETTVGNSSAISRNLPYPRGFPPRSS